MLMWIEYWNLLYFMWIQPNNLPKLDGVHKYKINMLAFYGRNVVSRIYASISKHNNRLNETHAEIESLRCISSAYQYFLIFDSADPGYDPYANLSSFFNIFISFWVLLLFQKSFFFFSIGSND